MYVLEQLLFTLVFSARLERRPLSRRRLCLIGLLLAALCALQLLITYPARHPETGLTIAPDYKSPRVLLSSLLICTLLFFFMVLLVLLTRRVQLPEALYAATCAYAGEHLAYCARLLCQALSALPLVQGSRHPLYWLINLSVAASCYFFFARPMIQKEHYSAPPMEALRLIAVVTIVILYLSILSSAYDFSRLHAIYASIFCLSILYYQRERQKALALAAEAALREHLLLTQRAQYESYRENVELVNRKCHDLKHQVEALRGLGPSQQQRALQEMEEAVLIYDCFVKTGNGDLDTILTQKHLLCTEKEILFTCVADGSLLSFMDPVDLYTLFGNLCDNAIEAVEKLPKEQRSIHLTITQRLGMILIREENPFLGDLKKEEGRIATTKADRANHGYGLRSMELVAEKYQGVLSCQAKESLFTLTLALPAP